MSNVRRVSYITGGRVRRIDGFIRALTTNSPYLERKYRIVNLDNKVRRKSPWRLR